MCDTGARFAPIFLLPCLLLVSAPALVQADLTCWTQQALVKVMPEDEPTGETAIKLRACRNEVEWGQVVLRSSEPATVRLRVKALTGDAGRTIPASQITFHPAVYVHVSIPSGNRARAPYWPEILPRGDTVELQPDRNQPVYVQVRVPETAAPGVYIGSIEVVPLSSRLPLTLRVWPLTLPRVPTTRTSYYVWWDGIEKRFGLNDGPANSRPLRRQRVFDRFWEFMLDHRLCPMVPPGPMPYADRYMREPRANGIRLPYENDDARLQAAISHMKSRGWLDRCYYYLFDEPAKRMWPEVRRAGFQIAALDPFMARLDTIQPEPELEGAVSIWCPNVESVHLYDDRIREVRSRLEAAPTGVMPEVWWYTCVFPKYPYPTFLLDDDAIAPRLLFWQQPRHGLSGSMYINTIHWGPEGNDPWIEASVDPVLLNNNDGLLMYTGRGTTPADAYPVTGVRLEMIRDGLEDAELCNMLQAEIARRAGLAAARQHLAALASQIMPDLRHCDRDPAALQRLRRRVVHEIMDLQKAPAVVHQLLKLPMKTVPEPEGPIADDKFAVALRGTPVIDGKLDDPIWEQARAANAPGTRTTITRFRNLTGRIWPPQDTVVNCLYDDDNAYFGFQCQEPEVERLAPFTETQDLAKADRVAVALPVSGQTRWHVVSMEGLRFEGDLHAARPVRGSGWEAKTRLDANGYTVEVRLPRPEGLALFNLFRYAAPGDETLYFTGRHSSKRNPFQFGTLELR